MTGGYDIFISYRRETGAAEARLIRLALMEKGKRTFLDVTDLRGGFFDEALLGYIAAAPNFVLILSPGSLDRCVTEEDWFRREIVHALRSGTNIVPVFVPGFAFPPQLPDDLRNLPRHQGVDYSHRYFDAMVEEILRVCESARTNLPAPSPPPLPDRGQPPAVALPAAPPQPRQPPKRALTWWIVASAIVIALILGGVYFAQFYSTPPFPQASPSPEPSSTAVSAPVKTPASTPAPHPPAPSPSSPSPEAAPPDAANLIGTKWEIDGNPYTTEFLAGGGMNLVDGTIADHAPPRSWTQTGDHVSIHMPFVSYEMTLSGDEMSGTQQVLKNAPKPARARRVR